MSKKSSLSSRLKSPSSSDISSVSFIQEEIPDLIVSRRVDLRNTNHLQTLSGHIFDILKSLSELLDITFQRLDNSCRNFSINPSLVCESLFLAVCRYYLFKAENYDKTKLKLADENSIRQTESYDLLRFALETYLKLTKNSTQNGKGRKTSSQRKSGDHINENGSTIEVPAIRIKNMSRFMWHFYNKLNFERWFTISKPDIQDFAGDERIDDNLQVDLAAMVDEKSHDTGFRIIYSIVSYYTKTCISVADRAFLNEIYGDFRDEACVIHGSSCYKPHSRNRIFKLQGNRSSENIKNTSIDLCLHKSYDKKMKYALRWFNNLFVPPVGLEKSKLLIIACTEEELISLAFNLRNEFSVEEIYYFCCGLVGLSKKNAGSLDTKLFKPDRCSEPMEKLPVNTASVSMYTYGDFLQRFFPHGKNGNAAKGEIILSNVLLWGVPDGDAVNKDGYCRILEFLRDNKIPALAMPGIAENSSAEYFSMEDTHRK
ncbi:hypothetical protein IID62_11870 [candidate division KSB1 bacterium]|nr:hypothetical protein [candidate division KSB1 bacterium]